MKSLSVTFLLLCLLTTRTSAQDNTTYSQQEIIYDHKDGMALTMTVITPKKANGKAIISLNSGAWVSSPSRQASLVTRALPFVNNGYTVFLALHGSAPKYAIDDAIFDIKRAIQFVRYKAAAYGVDSLKIGITGTSSGGHLALLAGVSDDIRDPQSKDPLERVSSKVQAVAVFCPPTDFLNYGQAGFNLSAQPQLLAQHGVLGAFEFKQWDSAQRVYTIISNKDKFLEIVKSVSPAQLITADDAPTYIMHGDQDPEVPLQQSQLVQQKMAAVKVPVTLTVKPGAGHGWKGMNEDEQEFVKWFDLYLGARK